MKRAIVFLLFVCLFEATLVGAPFYMLQLPARVTLEAFDGPVRLISV
jgi:hypothetical protein